MGDTSLVGTVDLMTGEKDPRNLMLVFSILKVIMVEWDISNHVEVGFDPSTVIWTYANFGSSCLILSTTTSQSLSDHHQMIHMGLLLKT
jgi:hypothetical protein